MQNMLAMASKDSRTMCEEELKSRAHLEDRLAQLSREKAELWEQVTELSQQKDLESKKCIQLEGQNKDLQEELSALHGSHEKLEKSKCQLKEEVANLFATSSFIWTSFGG